MNFYEVKIGQYSKKGAFQENIRFVCSSKTENIREVESQLASKYEGFDVLVGAIRAIIALNDEKAQHDEDKSKHIKEVQALKGKINALERGWRTFESEYLTPDHSAGTTEFISEMIDSQKKLDANKEKAMALVSSNLMSKYKFVKVHVDRVRVYNGKFLFDARGQLPGEL